MDSQGNGHAFEMTAGELGMMLLEEQMCIFTVSLYEKITELPDRLMGCIEVKLSRMSTFKFYCFWGCACV